MLFRNPTKMRQRYWFTCLPVLFWPIWVSFLGDGLITVYCWLQVHPGEPPFDLELFYVKYRNLYVYLIFYLYLNFIWIKLSFLWLFIIFYVFINWPLRHDLDSFRFTLVSITHFGLHVESPRKFFKKTTKAFALPRTTWYIVRVGPKDWYAFKGSEHFPCAPKVEKVFCGVYSFFLLHFSSFCYLPPFTGVYW